MTSRPFSIRQGGLHRARTMLRLCGLLDVYDYGDCAIEILEEFRGQLSKSRDVDALIQAATPAVEGVVLEYESYLDWSNKIRQKLNQVEYDDSGWQPKARLRQQAR